MSDKRKIEIRDENEGAQEQESEFQNSDLQEPRPANPEMEEDDMQMNGGTVEDDGDTAVMEQIDEWDALKAKIEELESENEKLTEESKSNYDKFIRATADLDNFKKRSNKEMGDLRKFANENIVRDILSVADNLERAIESGANGEARAETILQGVEITLKDVLRMLERYQVKSFESIGEAFDPQYHQAMMQQESDEFPENTVLQELQKGYTIHDRLLRPAMVIVSKATSDPAKNENE